MRGLKAGTFNMLCETFAFPGLSSHARDDTSVPLSHALPYFCALLRIWVNRDAGNKGPTIRDYNRAACNKGPAVFFVGCFDELYSWIQHSAVEGIAAEADSCC